MMGWRYKALVVASFSPFLLAAATCARTQVALDGLDLWHWTTVDRDATAKDGSPVRRVVTRAVRLDTCSDGIVIIHNRWTEWCGAAAPLVDGPGGANCEWGWYLTARPQRHDREMRDVWHRGWWARAGPDWRLWVTGWEAVEHGVLVGRATAGQAFWIPHWWLLIATGMPMALWVRRWRRERRRRRESCCRRCGYDLRGNPAAAACPECGTPLGR